MTKRDHRPFTPAPILMSIGRAGNAVGTADGTGSRPLAEADRDQAGRAPTATAPAAATAPTAPTATDAWPRRTYLELEALASTVPQARRHVKDTLAHWGLGEVCSDAELISCELLTNAISASTALPFLASVGLLLAACPGRLITLVWDASLQPPVPSAPDDDAAGGRGLAIVDALSTRWGWVPDERGKIVWAMIDLRPASDCSCPTYHGFQS